MEKGNLKSQIQEEELMKGITQIIEDLLKPDFNVKKIYSKEERKNYIKNFPEDKQPNKTHILKKSWFFNDKCESHKKIKDNKSNPPCIEERKTLIPKTCELKIKSPRISKIY